MCEQKKEQSLFAKITTVLLTALMVPISTNAQQSTNTGNTLEEVIVTARRVSENLQEVPVTITAVSGTQLEDRLVTNMFALPMISPGLFTTVGATRSTATIFSIRGQASRNVQPGTDASVGVYFADVPWARSDGLNTDVFDLESVQVLKGPQGTLFGRNSPGGSILISPRAPTYEFDGYVKATMGNYNMRGTEGVANIPIVQDRLALRLGGQYRLRDGYMVAINTGQKFDDVDSHSVRASLLWTPTEQFTSTTIFSHFRSDTVGNGVKVRDVIPAPIPGILGAVYPFAQKYFALSQQLGKYEFFTAYAPDVEILPQALALPNPPGYGPLPYVTGRHSDTKTQTIQNTTVWEAGELGVMGDVSFKDIVGYRRVISSGSGDNTGMPLLSSMSVGNTSDMDQISNEFQILGTKGALDYVLGLFAFREQGGSMQRSYSNTTNANFGDAETKNLSKSVFAHLTYDLSTMLEGLSANIGGRITKDNRYLINRNYQQRTDGRFQCRILSTVITATPDSDVCAYPTSVSYSEPTWNIGLNYQYTPDNMVYASASRGYRSGGLQLGATTVPTASPYFPEFVNNYEIGSKNTFQLGNMSARLNVTAYYSDLKDLQRQVNQVFEISPGVTATITNLYNATSGNIKGVDTEFTLQPTERLELSVNYALIDPKYNEYTDLVQGSNGISYPVDISDSYFPYTSRNSVTANATYTLPMDSRLGELSVVGSYSYRTSFITNTDSSSANCFSPQDPNRTLYSLCWSRAGLLPGYGIANLSVNWQNLMGWGVDASFFVENVTNKFYYMFSYSAYNALSNDGAMPGAPRMFGMNVSIPFGAGVYR